VYFDLTGRLCDEIAIASLDLRSKIALLARNNKALQLNDQFLRDRRDNVAMLEAALGFSAPVTETLQAEKSRPRGRPPLGAGSNAPDHLADDMWRIDNSKDLDGDERYFHDSFWKYSTAGFQGASSRLRQVRSHTCFLQ
jgi:hypothetical protein